MFSFGCVCIFPNRRPATNIDLFCGLLLYFSLNSSTPPRTTPRPWHTSSTTASSPTASGRTQNIRAMDSYLPSPLALRCSKARNSPSTTGLIWRCAWHFFLFYFLKTFFPASTPVVYGLLGSAQQNCQLKKNKSSIVDFICLVITRGCVQNRTYSYTTKLQNKPFVIICPSIL